MEKAYQAKDVEPRIYALWEKGGYFTPRLRSGQAQKQKPFSIILPPPNANAPLHIGHAMYTIEDIYIRFHRMLGDETLWLPGADHAGFETQYVFEKQLAKEGKSRFDFDRETLYKMIWDFVQKNRGTMENQLRRLGFSLDWTRQVFTLDPKIVKIVYKTFKKLYDDGLVYRGERLVNYCTRCGTGFSDLEVKHVEQIDPLYYMKYGPFILATVRPETKFGDTAVAVHPHDNRYKQWVGKEVEVEGLLSKFTIKVIADDVIDPTFGTGVAKVTPAHDMKDFEIGKRHNLAMKLVIGFDGRLTKLAGPYAGMRVKAARAKVAEDLDKRGLIDHIDQNYTHTIATCYKCGTTLEPLPLPQWYIKIRPLADPAIKAIKDKRITFIPKRFEKRAIQWLKDFHDWNISRQLVWGIRIPAWFCKDCRENNKESTIVTEGKQPSDCPQCNGNHLEQETDTFDTWFSSGQWPFATLRVNQPGDFDYFYPTSVMETGYDILPWWVCRMIMLGLYATDKVPFKTVYLHGLVRDAKGQKMSKSKGNVINPLDMVEKYGADSLRMALIFGAAAGNDLSLSEDKIRGMRNFANKLWNISRLLLLNFDQLPKDVSVAEFRENLPKLTNDDKTILKELQGLIHISTKGLSSARFSDVAQSIYDFAWHRFADWYVESSKFKVHPPVRQLTDGSKLNGDTQTLTTTLSVYRHVLITILKLLHPFMPFVTEEIWGKIPGIEEKPLIVASWPISK